MNIVETNIEKISTSDPLLKPLLDSERVYTLILNLPSTQAIAPCKMSFTVLYYFIEGQGEIRIEDEKAEYQTGSLVVVPAGAIRSIRAALQTFVLVVQIK
jgi:quercetin dioxygenase-like cupin family protein